MKKNSKVIVLERNSFALLVKTHRKSLLMLNVLTYICRVRKVRLVMTLEEVCQVMKLNAAEVERQRQKGLLRYSEDEGICLYEISDLIRLKNAIDMIGVYRLINDASVSPISRE